MWERITQFIEERLRIPEEQFTIFLQRLLVGIAALSFVLTTTVIVAFDSIFVGVNNIANLQEGAIAPRDIVAPTNPSPYISAILTDQARAEARDAVQPIYLPPDPDVARQQTELAGYILDYIVEVRGDIYGTNDQRIADLDAIASLTMQRRNAEAILQLNDETWSAVEDEILAVLSRLMRNPIRPGQETNFRAQLGNQVTSRFNTRERDVIVDILDDLVVPNTFEDVQATNDEREATASAVESRTRRFIAGQIIVREGEPINALTYEALVAMNLLRPDDLRVQEFVRALVASTILLVLIGLYLARYVPHLLYHEPRHLLLVSTIFLFALASIRLFGTTGDIYLFPYAAVAMLYVAVHSSRVAIAGALGLAFLTGLMNNDSLQVVILISAGSIMGILALRRAERLNAFFVAGVLVGGVNAGVVAIFNISTASAGLNQTAFTSALLEAIFSGVLLVPATSVAVMYVVSQIFNLPTALKLIDLSQPSKPLLQRLLREAPGTYQHSLQVANLAEQAANAIEADAQLTHVAALYHDIGKMLNPLFFTENQQDIGNPHDAINDPYRSAGYIIGHVTEGDDLAKQYRLPQRIRDFIREHHGTTEVYVFYQRALNQADGDASQVDANDFRYPGPRPRSKETAILMMADSCEAAVRSVKPESKQEIRELVTGIINGKRDNGQLDESGLTLNDLHVIREIFVDILQSIFHPRINYKEAVAKKLDAPKSSAPAPKPAAPAPKSAPAKSVATPESAPDSAEPAKTEDAPVKKAPTTTSTKPVTKEIPPLADVEIEDEEPLNEVPRLPSLDERRSTGTHNKVNDNGAKNRDEKRVADDN